MSITFEEMQALLRQEGINFFISPDRPQIRFSVRGRFNQFDLVLTLQNDGQFLQFRTLNYLSCPTGHAHIGAVHQVICDLNNRRRLVKWGWDPADGEIMAYADHWIMDGTVTQGQFNRLLSNFLPAIDEGYHTLHGSLETGVDPGPPVDSQSLGGTGGGGEPPPMPPELRAVLDKLKKEKGDAAGPDDATPTAPGTESPEIKEI